MATAADNYLQQGIDQAIRARDATPWGMGDVWKDYASQYAIAKQANDQEIAMWNMQNEYNSPAAQMQRWKEAGLNPMLAYTQGSPGNATSAPGVHAPNVKINPDTVAIQQASAILGSISQLADTAFGIADKGMDLQLKANEVDMSNFENAVASQYLLGYGQGRHAGSHTIGFLGNHLTALDPHDPNFDPTMFQLLNRMGLSSYYPREMTAEASAKLAGERYEYQKIYNEKILPLVEKRISGQITATDFKNEIVEYQKDALEALPASVRGWIEPLYKLLIPLIK